MGRSTRRGRRARDNDTGATSAPQTDSADCSGSSGNAEREVVDALLQLGRSLRAMPMGPSDSFRGNLRERLTTAPMPRPDHPRP